LSLRVQVLEARLDGTGTDRHLRLKLSIENTSSTNPLEYTAWSTSPTGDSEVRAIAADDQDTLLTPLPAADRSQASSWRIQPGDKAESELAFGLPRDEFEFVRLVLPYAAIGEQGYMGFEIPVSMIEDAARAAQETAAADGTTTPGGAETIPGQNDTIDDLRARIRDGVPEGTPADGGTPVVPDDPTPQDAPPDSNLELRRSIRDNIPPDAEPESQ
jgi:hypothetical protein